MAFAISALFLLLDMVNGRALACAPIPSEAQAVIREVRLASKNRDFPALRRLLIQKFTWSFGGDGDADQAVDAWKRDAKASQVTQARSPKDMPRPEREGGVGNPRAQSAAGSRTHRHRGRTASGRTTPQRRSVIRYNSTPAKRPPSGGVFFCATFDYPIIHMKNIFKAIAAISPILLSGCGALPNIHDPARIVDGTPAQGAGIVILSTRVDHPCSLGTGKSTFLKIMPEGMPFSGPEKAALSVDSSFLKSDFVGYHGKLHAVSLAPGNYYLAPALAQPNIVPLKVPQAEFSVAAGEVVYLGQYYMSSHCGLKGAGRFIDQREKDMEFLAKKNPELAKQKIVTRVLIFSGRAVDED